MTSEQAYEWLAPKLHTSEREALDVIRKDAERYRWLRARNTHYVHDSAWLNSVTARKKTGCDIFSAEEVPALLDAEIDRRMAAG